MQGNDKIIKLQNNIIRKYLQVLFPQMGKQKYIKVKNGQLNFFLQQTSAEMLK